MSEKLPGEEEEARGSTLQKIGLALTALYVISVFGLLLVGYCFGWVKMEPLGLNEIGDFLAGVFGTLAIAWLVLGFMQQGSELRLQVNELKNSVAQQKELVEETRKTLKFERDQVNDRKVSRRRMIEPRLKFQVEKMLHHADQNDIVVKAEIANEGNNLTLVKFDFLSSQHFPYKPEITTFGHGEAIDIDLHFDDSLLGEIGRFTVSCLDEDKQQHGVVYEIDLHGGSNPVGIREIERTVS